jgi:hypothetical protein
MYAAIFVCCVEFVILRKNIYWQISRIYRGQVLTSIKPIFSGG